MTLCYLCQANDKAYFHYYCEKCSKIKRLISLYSLDRVYDILETVLVRTRQQQNYKMSNELEVEKNLITTKINENKLEDKILRNGKKC